MITELQLLRNVGPFNSVNAEDTPLAPLTLICAENGRGKTMLAAVRDALLPKLMSGEIRVGGG